MNRYFFHLDLLTDIHVEEEGQDFADLDGARSAAVQDIRNIAARCLWTGETFTLWNVRICNERGDLLDEVLAAEQIREILPPEIFFDSDPRGLLRP